MLYAQTHDSIFDLENSKQLAEMQTKYETERKEHQISLLNKDKKLSIVKMEKAQAETDRQTNQRNMFILAFLLMFVLCFFAYRGYRHKQKANEIISHQKQE